jgi:hypothetical protein
MLNCPGARLNRIRDQAEPDEALMRRQAQNTLRRPIVSRGAAILELFTPPAANAGIALHCPAKPINSPPLRFRG